MENIREEGEIEEERGERGRLKLRGKLCNGRKGRGEGKG